MSTVKEQAAQLVEQLPDHASWSDLMYQIYVREKAAAAIHDAQQQTAPAPAELESGPTSFAARTPPGEGQSFSQRWRGKFVPADRKDERYQALARRYL